MHTAVGCAPNKRSTGKLVTFKKERDQICLLWF